jgi:HEAT repeat protein
MSLSDDLYRIFDADRTMRRAEAALLRTRSSDELVALLAHETKEALSMEDRREATMRLERLADLCAQVHGPAIERALDRGDDGLAMSELPWILAEIAEPSALPLIRRFLDHPNADVVAAAIEALSQLQEPEAAQDLLRFVGDKRVVTIEDFEDETKTTIGELAEEALEALGQRLEG